MKIREWVRKAQVTSTYRRVSTKRYKIDLWLWKWTITVTCQRKEYQVNGGKTT